MSDYKQKHKAPIGCRIRAKILYRPSAFNYCAIGCYRKNYHCNNCVENISEIICDGFVEGMKQCADEGTLIDILKKQKTR